MNELTQTRNHLVTTTTIRSIRVSLRHSLGLIALLAAGLGLNGCGNSAGDFSPCEIQLGGAQRGLLQCTLQAIAGGNASCTDDFLEKVAQVRDQYGSSDECSVDAETNGALAALAASFVPSDAPNRPMPAVSVDRVVLSAQDPMLTRPELRPASLFPGYEELVARGSSARTSELSSPSQNLVPAGYECNSSGWCVDGLPVTDESFVCVEPGTCGQTVAKGAAVVRPASDVPSLRYANPELVTPTSQACVIGWILPIWVPKDVAPKDRHRISGSYSVLVCPS
jgi:hypothetical protein